MLFQGMQVHYNELQRGAPLGLRLFPSSWNYRCPDLLFVTRLRLWSGCPVFNDCISLPKSTTLAVRVLHIFNSLHMQSEAFGAPRIIFILSQTTQGFFSEKLLFHLAESEDFEHLSKKSGCPKVPDKCHCRFRINLEQMCSEFSMS